MTTNWLMNGGAFWVIGLAWLFFGIAYPIAAVRMGDAYDAPQDGCFVAFLCVLLVLIGGGLGLLGGLWGTLLGSGLLPGIALALWSKKTRPHR